MNNQIVFLHGFLGAPSDWDIFYVYYSDRYECLTPSLLSIRDLETFGKTLPDKAHLVGYSMGGRLALWLHHLFPNKFSSLSCISAHPGLEQGREERLASDQHWIDQMRRLPTEEFIKIWYSNPIFKDCPIPKERMDVDLYAWSHMLQKFTIAKQPNFWNDLPLTKIPILFLFGAKDEKYSRLATRLNALGKLVQAKVIPDSSHTVHLEDPMACIRALNTHWEDYDR